MAALLAGSVWWDNAVNRGVSGESRTAIAWADVPLGGVNVVGIEQEVVTPEQRRTGDNKVAQTFRMIRDGGFHFVRVQFPWEDIEVCGRGDFRDCRPAGRGQSTWTKYDYIVEQAAANGLALIVRLDRPPEWARRAALASPEVRTALEVHGNVTGPPDRYEDYASFVAAVAKRYRDRLRFYQIWNEPNLPGEWNYRRQNPVDFVRLLRLAGGAIKANDPDAVILFPALSPTDGADGVAVNDLDYLQGVYDAGGRDAFDIMSAQLYGLGQPPDEHRYVAPGSSVRRPLETRADVGRVVLQREIMVRNGDADKAIWISEFGWNSAPPELGRHPWGVSVTEEQKGEYIVGAMTRARREWPWMGAMCVWMFRWGGLPPDPADPTPFFQLVDFDFQPLPAYEAVSSYLRAMPDVAPATGSAVPVVASAAATTGLVAALAWLWPELAAVAGVLAGLTLAAVVRLGKRLRAARAGENKLGRWLRRRSTVVAALIMVVGLLIFYRASAQLPLTLLGALIFLPVALIRPDLALLAVVATVPLYLAPKGVWDQRFGLSRPQGYFLPLHEFALLASAAGSLPAVWRGRERIGDLLRGSVAGWPAVLFLVAGTLGVVVAGSPGRGAALREWRWLIVEPLIFYALVRLHGQTGSFRRRIIWTWLLTGAVVAAIGVLQLAGLDLAVVLRGQPCFSEPVVFTGGVARATSVYCHPNNLGLALGRVWPVLAAFALAATSLQLGSLRVDLLKVLRERQALLPAALAALVLAGLGASFSKGAFLGAFAALVALAVIERRRALLGVAGIAAGVVLIGAALAGWERLNPLGGSSGARLELWGSAAAMLRDHSWFGVGLDQFYRLRNQEVAGPYISAAATQTSERFASHPHNVILDTLVRIGPLGLVALGALLARFFRHAYMALRHGRRRDQALAAGLVAAMLAGLVHGLVDNFLFVPDLAMAFWLHLGLVDLLYDRSDCMEPGPMEAGRRNARE